MLLGKRQRPPMKRTTSMNEIIFDVGVDGETTSQTHSHNNNPVSTTTRPNPMMGGGSLDGLDQRLLSSLISPRFNSNSRRHSGDFSDSGDFLRACCLCKRRLVPGRDIYMYRGDSAFCSLECRQQQMNQDERKDKCSFASAKKQASSAVAGAGSMKGETTVAAV